MASVKWSEAALDDLERIDRVIAERILAKVSWFEKNFERIVPEKLHYTLKDSYKLRVGDYRVIYTIETKRDVLVIQGVGHRRDVYKK